MNLPRLFYIAVALLVIAMLTTAGAMGWKPRVESALDLLIVFVSGAWLGARSEEARRRGGEAEGK